MKWRIAAAMMLVSVAAMAQDTSPLHEVGPSAMNHGPATFASFEDRVDADARDYIARYPDTSSDRFVKFDTTMPLEAPEYEAMGKYAIVLVAAFSQNAKELPLGVVRAGDLKLHCVGQIHRTVTEGTPAAKFFGANRVDAFYIVPVAVLKRGAVLTADFARNRTGFTVGELSAEEAPDFIVKDPNPAPTHAPRADALNAMIEREYPGFGIEVRP